MKNFLLVMISTIGLLLFSQKATAQWDIIADLYGQMDSTVYGQFQDSLGNFGSTWDTGDLNNGLLSGLYNDANGGSVGGTLDSSYLDALNEGLDLLNQGLPNYGLPGADSDTIIGQYGYLDSLFNANFDSLGGLYGNYQDSLVFDSAWTSITVIGLDAMQDSQFDILQDSFDNSMPEPGNIAGLIGKLFDEITFPDLELAFGQQSGDFKYYEDRYSANASVIRVGSLPRYDKKAPRGSFPIEPRWHVEASWTKGRTPSSISNDNVIANNTDENKLTPLLFNGDFAIMLTPQIGAWGNTTFKLVTSLGMEFGTYAPAHKEYDYPYTSANQGFDTGFGPQAGVGFAMITGPLTVYSLNTVAQGTIVQCKMPYRYNSKRFEVGMRYGNIINVRYTTGNASWQEDGNRWADIKNQITVGIILQNRPH